MMSIDINECVTNNMIRCQNHETCINAPGYYTCQCKDGFQRKEYESDCVGMYIINFVLLAHYVFGV